MPARGCRQRSITVEYPGRPHRTRSPPAPGRRESRRADAHRRQPQLPRVPEVSRVSSPSRTLGRVATIVRPGGDRGQGRSTRVYLARRRGPEDADRQQGWQPPPRDRPCRHRSELQEQAPVGLLRCDLSRLADVSPVHPLPRGPDLHVRAGVGDQARVVSVACRLTYSVHPAAAAAIPPP